MSKPWPMVPLGEVLTERREVPSAEDITTGEIRIVSKIGFNDGQIQLREDGTTRTGMILIRPGDLVVSGINAVKGAIAIYGNKNLKAIAATIHYCSYIPNKTRVDIKFLWWLLRSRTFRDLLLEFVSGGIKTELKAKRFLPIPVPLPPLSEQRRIVGRIGELAGKIEEARTLREAVENDEHRMLLSAFYQMSAGAPRLPMSEVAPLSRRPISVDYEKEYPQVAVRSFGRGTFHQPVLLGAEITWQKPYLVKSGDILISNIKAWEGAVAVATKIDNGRFGSHRYLTCVPVQKVATALFVCFYLLTAEGLHELGEASPGSADRNRTLSAKGLMRILIPVPSYEEQQRFDALFRQVEMLKNLQAETTATLDALLPAILDKAFRGKL